MKISGEDIRQEAARREETAPKGMKGSFYYGFREGAKWAFKVAEMNEANENDDKEGLFLCRVKGLEFTEFAVLKFEDGFWWQYTRQLADGIEGWIGIDNDLEIVEILQQIE